MFVPSGFGVGVLVGSHIGSFEQALSVQTAPLMVVIVGGPLQELGVQGKPMP
jgi:hypothetical protein